MTGSLDLTVGAVLVDMDGTLVDSTAVCEAMWARFAAEHGLDPEILIPRSHGRQTIDTLWEFLPDHPAPVIEALEAAFSQEEVNRADEVVEIPGAGALMTALADVGAPVALVTSAPRELALARMIATGVPLPDVVVTPELITQGKPHPEGYLRAAALLDVPIEDCVVLEDAEAGIAAALASGAQVLIVGPHASALTRDLPRVPDLSGVSVLRSGDRIRLTA